MKLLNNLLLRGGFQDYFGFPSSVNRENQYTTFPADTSYMFQNCVFENVSQTSIRFSINTEIYLLVESCMFAYCFSGFRGGAICFECGEMGSAVYSRNCGFYCGTYRGNNDMYYGQFIYSSAKNEGLNYYLQCSISKCGPNFLETRQHSSTFYNGRQRVSLNNFSFCECRDICGLSLDYSRNCEMNMTTFVSNMAQRYHCMQILNRYVTFTYNISFCNYVKNTDSVEGSTIYAHGAVLIRDSIFLDNGPYLFSNGAGTLTATRNYVKHIGAQINPSKTSTLSFTSFKNTDVTTNTLQIDHYATYYCDNYGNMALPDRTYPPEPTSCDTFHTATNEGIKLLSIFHLMANCLAMVFLN